jgi:LmbE family N-acetylglucosaminyl deacetylase
MAAPETTHVVDVTDTFDRKMAALRCHRSQIADAVALETRVRGWLADGARRAGLPEGRLVESFRAVQIF